VSGKAIVRVSKDGPPVRQKSELGTLQIEFIYFADDGTNLSLLGTIDRWACTSLLTGTTRGMEQVTAQLVPLFASFVRELRQRYGFPDDTTT
jgi:hypothetical protein